MDDCIICKIANKELEQSIIYEDDFCIVFPDKHPIQPGHILVVPKKHEPDYWKLQKSIYDHLMNVSYKFSSVLDEIYKPQKVGFGIFGFDIPHVHFHLVPMHDRDDIVPGYVLPGKTRVTLDIEAIKETSSRIKSAYENIL